MTSEYLIHGYFLIEPPDKRQIHIEDLSSLNTSGKKYWIHLNGKDELAHKWLQNESNIDPQILEIMLSKQTRARFVASENGFLIVLKAINQDPSGTLDDVVSVRIYVEKDRIISLSRKNELLLPNLNQKITKERTSFTPFEILIQIANELFTNLEKEIETLDDEVDRMDELMNESGDIADNLVPLLSQIRSQTIILKSYLTPQKEVLRQLMNVNVSWFAKNSKSLFLNFSEKISLFLENLEVIKERTVVTLDEIRIRNVEKTNRNSYIFSVVAVLFLPLGFLTGLFGMNLAGIPGANHPWSFTVFCLAILGLSTALLIVLKRIKWI